MRLKHQGDNNGRSQIRVRLDRVQFRARAWTIQILFTLGFRRLGSRFVRKQTPISTYTRVDIFFNPTLRIKIFVQRKPACSWLWPLKITVIPDDTRGLSRTDLDSLLRAFTGVRFLTAELAIDFRKHSGVDEKFVLRHGLFGKSQPVEPRFENGIRFGSRLSSTHVRAYAKDSISAYRVESELRREWLSHHQIRRSGDLASLVDLIVPGRVQFVRVDWPALTRHMSAKSIAPDGILREARAREASIHETLRYLRTRVGMANLYRFLRPLPVNKEIQKAVEDWSSQWVRSGGAN
jgi:hypothetical protein